VDGGSTSHRAQAHPAADLVPPRPASGGRRPAPLSVVLPVCLGASALGAHRVVAAADRLHRGLHGGAERGRPSRGPGPWHAGPPGVRWRGLACQSPGAGAGGRPPTRVAVLLASVAAGRMSVAFDQRSAGQPPFPRSRRTASGTGPTVSHAASQARRDPGSHQVPLVASDRLNALSSGGFGIRTLPGESRDETEILRWNSATAACLNPQATAY
jgi:hypothetical protein